LKLPYKGDKRVFGWDDYPHGGVKGIEGLKSYPHHFQRRREDGKWLFEGSEMRGDVEREVEAVIVDVTAFSSELLSALAEADFVERVALRVEGTIVDGRAYL
jgi:intein-encoded DNA endonuclease-like protein